MTRPKKAKPYSEDDIAAVLDNPKWTKRDFQTARPFAEVFPELAKSLRRGRGPQKAPTKVALSLRLSSDVVEKFKAGGPGWQTRMDKALRKAVGL